MGSWGDDPFDNDPAQDWSTALHECAPERRLALVLDTLRAVDTPHFVDGDLAMAAVAAAAVVHAALDGRRPTSPYAPRFLAAGEPFDLCPETRRLALIALDRVVAENCEWTDLWDQTDSLTEALRTVQALRDGLAG
ncbi:DUF4259 domain-containing protein [Pseudonocardiaceae bacterium YIM PH 21723]|nr:DUF4259 domain-containing protein [Pseudonocardiaceae bacterium YIM PH 21723]